MTMTDAFALVAATLALEAFRDSLPADLRVDGTTGPDTDADHCGIILNSALNGIEEVVAAVALYEKATAAKPRCGEPH